VSVVGVAADRLHGERHQAMLVMQADFFNGNEVSGGLHVGQTLPAVAAAKAVQSS